MSAVCALKIQYITSSVLSKRIYHNDNNWVRNTTGTERKAFGWLQSPKSSEQPLNQKLLMNKLVNKLDLLEATFGCKTCSKVRAWLKLTTHIFIYSGEGHREEIPWGDQVMSDVNNLSLNEGPAKSKSKDWGLTVPAECYSFCPGAATPCRPADIHKVVLQQHDQL